MPTWRLVVASQNHDQVGNRAVGDRSEHLDEDRLVLRGVLMLTAPFVPMLFQGEEWAASTPFQFFTDHPEVDLGTGGVRGPAGEFARWPGTPTVPDPQDPQTCARSMLDWSELEPGADARVLAAYQRLGRLRRSLPALQTRRSARSSCTADEATCVSSPTRRGSTS